MLSYAIVAKIVNEIRSRSWRAHDLLRENYIMNGISMDERSSCGIMFYENFRSAEVVWIDSGEGILAIYVHSFILYILHSFFSNTISCLSAPGTMIYRVRPLWAHRSIECEECTKRRVGLQRNAIRITHWNRHQISMNLTNKYATSQWTQRNPSNY